MKITRKAKNTVFTPSLEEYIEDKLVKPLQKLMQKGGDTVILDIEIERTTRHHKHGKIWRAEVNVTLGGRILRAEALEEDIHSALDVVSDEMKREIRAQRGKRVSERRKGERKFKGAIRGTRS